MSKHIAPPFAVPLLCRAVLVLTIVSARAGGGGAAGAGGAADTDFGRVIIDAGSRGEQMSPLIYSQFIEHLGRCIYGGIWAEMLEDRKFYYPITAQYEPYTRLRNTPYPVVGASPWEIIGWADAVAMAIDRPFVGRHTPRVAAGGGIRQRDLGVVRARKYVGYAWLKADEGRPVVEMALAWGDGPAEREVVRLGELTGDYRRLPVEFTAGVSTDRAMLEIRVVGVGGGGACRIGAVSLMPADNVEGLRADTLALLKELKAPIYRWPGGNFVSGYDWRDGIGERDRRPPRTNPAWTGVEHNDFGMHEFIRFCKLVGAEPWITVNTGFGDAYSAAAQLEYANGSQDTDWGRRRVRNGSAEPFAVRYWGIGNEMWGNWQLGYMKLDHYVLKQNWVVDKMREVDPKIITIASGNTGPWSTGLLKGSADHMDLIAEHFYCQAKPDVLAHVRQMNDSIRKKAQFHRDARKTVAQLKGKDIRVAMTEWNYWYGPHEFGELGTRYFLKDALGIAAGLHEYARNSDVIGSAFYAQTVNVIGGIKTSKTAAAFDSTGLVLKLYREQFGSIPLKTQASEKLDVQAMLTADGRYLTLGVVNPADQAVELPIDARGLKLGSERRAWQIVGDDLMAYNEPGRPPRVRIEAVEAPAGASVRVSPRSITLVKIAME